MQPVEWMVLKNIVFVLNDNPFFYWIQRKFNLSFLYISKKRARRQTQTRVFLIFFVLKIHIFEMLHKTWVWWSKYYCTCPRWAHRHFIKHTSVLVQKKLVKHILWIWYYHQLGKLAVEKKMEKYKIKITNNTNNGYNCNWYKDAVSLLNSKYTSKAKRF